MRLCCYLAASCQGDQSVADLPLNDIKVSNILLDMVLIFVSKQRHQYLMLRRFSLRKVPGLVKDVVAVASHPLASEQDWETLPFHYLRLRDLIVAPLSLPHEELSDLQYVSGDDDASGKLLTWISVSVMVDRLTLAYPTLLIPL